MLGPGGQATALLVKKVSACTHTHTQSSSLNAKMEEKGDLAPPASFFFLLVRSSSTSAVSKRTCTKRRARSGRVESSRVGFESNRVRSSRARKARQNERRNSRTLCFLPFFSPFFRGQNEAVSPLCWNCRCPFASSLSFSSVERGCQLRLLGLGGPHGTKRHTQRVTRLGVV